MPPMHVSDPVILGIETSCDETAAAVVRGGSAVLSNVIATQHKLHERYAGVVPEIASRAHLERITPVIRRALAEAGKSYAELDAISVGHRPGLIGSLLVGVSAAKALAWSLELPLFAVDHIVAHLYAGCLDQKLVQYPALGLVVSGGHTALFRVEDPLTMRLLGRTIDDAVGEAYDKAATILQCGYPGGPALDRLATTGDEFAFEFPVAQLGGDDTFDFSFSGLKTALLYAVRGNPRGRGAATTFSRDASQLNDAQRADLAASFQRAAVAALMRNLKRALERFHDTRTVIVGGGVSANSKLRQGLRHLESVVHVRIPPPEYCLDNAAMIAGLAAHMYHADMFAPLSLSAAPTSEAAL